jgi:hypothetical protein
MPPKPEGSKPLGGRNSDMPSGYVPPAAVILERLGISAAQLSTGGSVSVSAAFLRVLISEVAKRANFDPEWYARKYPDVESARLAGDIESLASHFVRAGFFEGRLPNQLPFDPVFYRKHYRDIAESFPSSDPEGMRDHFVTKGYFEGRAGTQDGLAEADFWRLGANG